MSSANLNRPNATTNIHNIYESWLNIKRREERAILHTSKKDWPNVIRICQSRQNLVEEHFAKYPVCPENAFFYRQHLSEHFKSNDLIQQVRRIAVKSCLHLVL